MQYPDKPLVRRIDSDRRHLEERRAQGRLVYNPIICGWRNYYAAFYPTAMLDLYMHIDRALERWARRKYKTLSGRLRAGVQWLRKMKDAEPQLFHHWRLIGSKVG
jgi:hypothetical protein